MQLLIVTSLLLMSCCMLQMAVDLVLDPDQIDTTVNDIGGLDNILERLVMHC